MCLFVVSVLIRLLFFGRKFWYYGLGSFVLCIIVMNFRYDSGVEEVGLMMIG